MNASLENKVAVVTGGTSGIGKATSLALAKAGAKVVVAGRRENEGQAVVQAIDKSGGKAIFVKTDVSREADVKALVDKTLATFGRLDIAFNNAGTEGQMGPTTDIQTSENYQSYQRERGLALHETRGGGHVAQWGRGHHQHLLHRRPGRFCGKRCLCGQQARRQGFEQERRPGIRQKRHSRKHGFTGHHPDGDDRAHARRRRK